MDPKETIEAPLPAPISSALRGTHARRRLTIPPLEKGTTPWSSCHEIVGAKMTHERLHFGEATIEAVSTLVALRLRFHGLARPWCDSAVRRTWPAQAARTPPTAYTRADCDPQPSARPTSNRHGLRRPIAALRTGRNSRRDPPDRR